jgi:tRNA(Ile)-lysidine synthase
MSGGGEDQPVRLSIEALRALPAALLGRVIRLVAARVLDSQLTREHTLAIASLVTGWKGQGPIHAPGIVVKREAGELVFCSRELLQ